MKSRIGLLLLIVVVVVVAFAMRSNKPAVAPSANGGTGTPAAPGELLTLKGFVGGEKMNFLKDPEVTKILQERYGLAIDADKRGSLEMVEDPKAAQEDFLWPSSQVALELYKESKRPLTDAEIIFNSPIILYSWGSITDALVRQKIVEKVNNAYYVVDFPKLIQLINGGKAWSALGVSQLYGNVTIFSTDPNYSNSGAMFAGLLADVLNGGQVVSDSTITRVLPTVKKYFDDQGYMERSSEDIFQQFLNRGMGDKPIIVGYEAQLLETSVQNRDLLSQQREPVRMLYPKPTVWSSHPLIAINANGKKLIAALQDAEIQRLAWQKHGFRSASGAQNDTKIFARLGGIPDTINYVIPMPAPRVMKQILQTVGGK